jgi:hypothetical protein
MVRTVWYSSLLVLALAGCQYSISGNPDVNLVAVHVSPIAATLPVNGKLQLNASLGGSTSGVSWSITSAKQDSIVSNGLSAMYYAPFAERSTSIRATSNETGSRYAETAITIVFPENDTMFAVSPSAVTMLTGATIQFFIDTMTTTEAIPSVQWSLISGPGSITSEGLYVSPSTVISDSTIAVIQATSSVDTAVHSIAQIVLLRSEDSIKCFTRDVLPILNANCGMTGCHNQDGKGGLNVLTYQGTMKSVVPGDARRSRLYTAITKFNDFERMPPPPASVLSPSAVLTIGQWIDQGAKDCQ